MGFEMDDCPEPSAGDTGKTEGTSGNSLEGDQGKPRQEGSSSGGSRRRKSLIVTLKVPERAKELVKNWGKRDQS
jgi:hypothetical protein